jgi:hypothetical protein
MPLRFVVKSYRKRMSSPLTAASFSNRPVIRLGSPFPKNIPHAGRVGALHWLGSRNLASLSSRLDWISSGVKQESHRLCEEQKVHLPALMSWTDCYTTFLHIISLPARFFPTLAGLTGLDIFMASSRLRRLRFFSIAFCSIFTL